MSSLKVLFCIAFGLLVLSSVAEAACGTCSRDSYAACRSATTFSPCTDGTTPSNQILTCSGNTVCTDTQGVCQPNVPGVVLGCALTDKCNDCSGGVKLACVSQTEFAYCSPDGQLGYVSSCEQGKLCSATELASSGKICGLSCLVEPTCQNTEPQPPPPGDFKETCPAGTAAGYYPNVHDKTCKEYVYCEEVNGVMNVIKYTCSTGYFDVVSQRCIQNKPSTCS